MADTNIVVLPEDWESQIRWALNAHVAAICDAGSLCKDKISHDGDAERCADDIAGDITILISDWMTPVKD